MSKFQNVGHCITIRTRNMNAGKLYAIRALKYPAKYPYSTLSRSTSMASCVSVVRWIPSVSHVKMSKCGTLYHDSDQKYECRQALRYLSTQAPCQIPIFNPLQVYKYGLLCVCSKMDTLCVTCQIAKMWDALSRFRREIWMQASFTLSEHSSTLLNTHIQPSQGLQVWPLVCL